MSIKVSDLVFADRADGYLPEAPQHTSQEDALALVRHIMRERSDCRNIPIVNEVSLAGEVNQYGHNLFIDVTYNSRRGWRATYGALLTADGVSNLQCYMD